MTLYAVAPPPLNAALLLALAEIASDAAVEVTSMVAESVAVTVMVPELTSIGTPTVPEPLMYALVSLRISLRAMLTAAAIEAGQRQARSQEGIVAGLSSPFMQHVEFRLGRCGEGKIRQEETVCRQVQDARTTDRLDRRLGGGGAGQDPLGLESQELADRRRLGGGPRERVEARW